jgi:hypothetical protein
MLQLLSLNRPLDKRIHSGSQTHLLLIPLYYLSYPANIRFLVTIPLLEVSDVFSSSVAVDLWHDGVHEDGVVAFVVPNQGLVHLDAFRPVADVLKFTVSLLLLLDERH